MVVKSPLYLTKKLVRWSTASCALTLAYQPFCLKNKSGGSGRGGEINKIKKEEGISRVKVGAEDFA